MEHLKIGCVVLAAGSARRFGTNKLTAELEGRSLILRTLEAIPDNLFDSVVVVTQYPDILKLARQFHFSALHNPRPEQGISYSIQLGLTALRDCGGVLFLVSDQPLLTRESVRNLVELWKSQPDKIAALCHNGVRGNPCLFPSRLFPELMVLSEDRGGSSVIRHHEEDLILLEVQAWELADADTPEALNRLKQHL